MYELYYKLDKSERPPTKILMRDYVSDGEVEAISRGEALRKWYSGTVLHADRVRNPETGDMIKDPVGRYFLLTSSGVWSLVSISKPKGA